jgi:hypothetical protein
VWRHATALPPESGPVGRFPLPRKKGFEGFAGFVTKEINN